MHHVTSRTVRVTMAACAGALALVLTGCGQSTDEAKGQFCDSLDDFSSTAMSYQGLDPRYATNDQLEEAADDLATAWDEVEQEAVDWTYADDNELTEAYDDLYDAAQDLPGDNTVAEDLEQLEPELDALTPAFQQTFDGSGCDDDSSDGSA
jgi:hypothetical protein